MERVNAEGGGWEDGWKGTVTQSFHSLWCLSVGHLAKGLLGSAPSDSGGLSGTRGSGCSQPTPGTVVLPTPVGPL